MKIESIASSLFGRFIGVPTLISFTEREIIITAENRSINILWQALLAPPTFHLSFFGQIITFKTLDKDYVFTMLAYNAKRKWQGDCETRWAAVHIQRLEKLVSSIKTATSNRYLRQSTIKQIQLAVNHECQRWFPWAKSSPVLGVFSKQLQALVHYQNWREEAIKACRDTFLNKQLQAYQSFFDVVESAPLTLRQRQACIIDNDNNLLLAGAGTGKTSVMVGRAGYLINSNQATHDEILLLAYGRKAANEMDDRIKSKLATDKISATTFHSLGLNIIAQVEGGKPSLSVFAEDEKAKLLWIESCFETFITENSHYRQRVVEYLTRYFYVERSDFTFNSLGERYQYYQDNDIRSLKGEPVKSFAELCIANELFMQGIAYQYQAKYPRDVKTMQRRSYQPDFYLPELNVYIEYYGIDENGHTAAYINKDEYYRRRCWKREIHKNFNTQCLELTYAQHKKGLLLGALRDELNERKAQAGVQIKTPTDVQILAVINECQHTRLLTQTLSQLVGLYKSACLTPNLEKSIIERSALPRQTEKALALLKPILTAYEQHLTAQQSIDFEDMINRALSYVKTGKFVSPWRYIMVDEFQDISEPRARLVKALRDSRTNTSVFAVGDDWQAIYRFSGADVTLTSQFSGYFGATTQSQLDQTFRFNNQISEVATNFISKNPAQIPKNIKALKQVKEPAISVIQRHSGNHATANNDVIDEIDNGALDAVLSAISAKVSKPVTVYLLARFWFLLPNAMVMKKLNKQYPKLIIEAQSLHASKGKEADYAIIIGLKKGVHGFPSEKITQPVIDALLAPQEDYIYAEERRLFYVALTRAKHRVYMIADMTQASVFVKELIDEHAIEQNEFSSTENQSNSEALNCVVCDTGKLKKREGHYGAFYICGHFPRCDHKEKACGQCTSLMTRKRYTGFKTCINELCDEVIPVCAKCNAEMVLRSSKNGDFWGCSNYKGNDPLSCKNALDNDQINWPKRA